MVGGWNWPDILGSGISGVDGLAATNITLVISS